MKLPLALGRFFFLLCVFLHVATATPEHEVELKHLLAVIQPVVDSDNQIQQDRILSVLEKKYKDATIILRGYVDVIEKSEQHPPSFYLRNLSAISFKVSSGSCVYEDLQEGNYIVARARLLEIKGREWYFELLCAPTAYAYGPKEEIQLTEVDLIRVYKLKYDYCPEEEKSFQKLQARAEELNILGKAFYLQGVLESLESQPEGAFMVMRLNEDMVLHLTCLANQRKVLERLIKGSKIEVLARLEDLDLTRTSFSRAEIVP